MDKSVEYQSGFGNFFTSEALAGALPQGQNSPQQVPYDLYAEQLSGSAFTAPRQTNLRSWLYRIQPSVVHGEFIAYAHPHPPVEFKQAVAPQQWRWSPLPYPKQATHFIDALVPYAHSGNCAERQGASVYIYAANADMTDCFFYNSDGDYLIVPQEGMLQIDTEFGRLQIAPSEIAVIPRGIKCQIRLPAGKARGYVCENYGAPFILPDLGPIGANGLANPRDFLAPCAAYYDQQQAYQLLTKFQDNWWQADINHNPLNVVAWHGNYVPYKYDLNLFCTMNTVSYDHPDPSIFTVLTSPSAIAGVANIDFVIFPERWMVAENTFRPPYFHRNLMSEFMGLIQGQYDAKQDGFAPGGCSIHNAFSAHGPDADTYTKALQQDLQPERYSNTLAFMFETRAIWTPTANSLQAEHRQADYQACWQGLAANFKQASKA